MNKYDKWEAKFKEELERYDKWIEEWKEKHGIACVLDFEDNFPWIYCANCKFGKTHYLEITCAKAKEKYVSLEGLLLQVLDRPYGKCKFFEPKEKVFG